MRRTLSLLAVFGMLCCVASVPRAQSAQTGLAYDEITKFLSADANPQPGSFASDFQAAINAQRSAANSGGHGGLFGAIQNAIGAAQGAIASFSSGFASSHYYLNGWERTDDVGAQTATIVKPSQRQTISLNLAKKTYRIETSGTANASEPVSPAERPQSGQERQAQPGSGRLDITVSTQSLGSQVIEEVPTTGYRTTFNMTQSQSTGSCRDGTFQTTVTEYVSRYMEPHAGVTRPRQRPASFARPERVALRPGCRPKITTHTSVSGEAPEDRLAMWVLVTVSGNAPSAEGQRSGGFSTLIERGNVRVLTANDSNLFAIPAGFTQEQ